MFPRSSATVFVADGTVVQQRSPICHEITRISALPNMAQTAKPLSESITELEPYRMDCSFSATPFQERSTFRAGCERGETQIGNLTLASDTCALPIGACECIFAG